MASELEMVGRLLMAAALGSVIGFERERLSWAAGLRTHMLVCVGATLFMLVSAYGFQEVIKSEHVVLDPSRVAAQVVSGIGFLGAGTILLRGEVIRGLTTAASLWSVAAIGLAIGGGLYTPAVAATLIILLILAGVKPLEARYFNTRRGRAFQIVAVAGTVTMQQLNKALDARSRLVRQFIVQRRDGAADKDEIMLTLDRLTRGEIARVVEQLRGIPGVEDVEEVDALN